MKKEKNFLYLLVFYKILHSISKYKIKNMHTVMLLLCVTKIDATTNQFLNMEFPPSSPTYTREMPLQAEQKTCFIMHADEDPQTKQIQHIVNTLQSLPFLQVIYARNGENNGLAFGTDMEKYMREGVTRSDFVIALYSPCFFDRSTNARSGISFELTLLLDRLHMDKNPFFIPILLDGCDEVGSIPTSLRRFLAITNIKMDGLRELISTIRHRIGNKNRFTCLSPQEETVIVMSQGSLPESLGTIHMSSQGSLNTQCQPALLPHDLRILEEGIAPTLMRKIF